MPGLGIQMSGVINTLQQINKLMTKVTLTLICIFLSFLASQQTLDWQGYGNMSSSNLTIIWGFIEPNIQIAVANSSFDKFSTDLSAYLNDQWDQAWNIILIQSVINNDGVLYGYAFRDHWMWYNGYQVQGSSSYYAFIIWKDYNCGSWKNVGKNGPITGFSSQQENFIKVIANGFSGDSRKADIWNTAYNFIQALTTNAFPGKDKAFSFVVAQEEADFYGSVCAFNGRQYYSLMKPTAPKWGRFLLFQTR